MSQTIEFTASSFSSILLREDLDKTWNDISLASLTSEESTLLLMLLQDINADSNPDFDAERILLVKASSGIPEAVYTPAIFRNDESIVIKIGVNLVNITQTEDTFTIGNLIGKMNVVEAEDKDSNPYPKATMSFIAQEHEDIYRIPVQLASKELGFTTAQLEAALPRKKPILPFLAPVPNGGAMKMHELGIGEFQLRAITEAERKYGKSYILHLIDGRKVCATGNVEKLLVSWRPSWEKPVTLVVADIVELDEDKYSTACALRERLPVLSSSTRTSNAQEKNGASTPTITVKAATVVGNDDSLNNNMSDDYYFEDLDF